MLSLEFATRRNVVGMGSFQELFHCVNESIAVKSLCEQLPQSFLLGVVYAGRAEKSEVSSSCCGYDHWKG